VPYSLMNFNVDTDDFFADTDESNCRY